MDKNVSELTGAALDWAVAKSMNLPPPYFDDHGRAAKFSSDWAQGGPIIEREEIFLAKSILGGWTGSIMTHDERVRCTMHEGETPLIAAMRCYVVSKLGDEVDVPDSFFPTVSET